MIHRTWISMSLSQWKLIMSFILFKLRNFLNREQLLQLYYAYVHSRLSYLCIVWGRSSKNVLRRVLVLQKRILKIIFHPPLLTRSSLLFCENLIDPLQFILFKQACFYVHSCRVPGNAFNINLHRNASAHVYATRTPCLYQQSRAKSTKYGIRSLENTVIRSYNRISDLLFEDGSVNELKNRLNRFVEENFSILYGELV